MSDLTLGLKRGICALTACTAVVGCGGGELDPTREAFSAVDDAALSMYWSEPSIHGMGVAIYDRNGIKVFEQMYGYFSPQKRVAIASASKMVSGVVLLRLVDQGKLKLDSTTGELLGWTGAKAGITLRHLLSFTSGLQPEASCTYRTDTTLADCVDEIGRTDPVAPPGTRFDYGSTHLHVAGRMAEVATGKPWNDLFSELLRAPLGLPPDLQYYANPLRVGGTQNPLLAGGLRMSMDEYEPLLHLVFDKGRRGGSQLLSSYLFDVQAIEPYPDVVIGTSPAGTRGTGFRYGLTAWLECSTPRTGCDIISSPGVFGFTPWVDRSAGYYAVIGMEVFSRPSGGQPVNFGVALAQQIKPLIAAAVARL